MNVKNVMKVSFRRKCHDYERLNISFRSGHDYVQVSQDEMFVNKVRRAFLTCMLVDN